jgi:hypothetical protein
MTDYHPLIARAIEGLGKSTGEARRALYERARTALVTQLRSVDPALSEAEITKERLALEEAIRKVEAEAARKSRMEPRTDPRQERQDKEKQDREKQDREKQNKDKQDKEKRSDIRAEARSDARAERRERASPSTIAAGESQRPARAEPRRPEPMARPKPRADEPDAAEAPRSARERLLMSRTSSAARDGIKDSIKGFRDVVSEVHDLGAASAKAAQSARETRDSYGPATARRALPPPPPEEPPAVAREPHEPPLPHIDDFDQRQPPHRESRQLRGPEPPPYEWENEQPLVPAGPRPQPPRLPTPPEAYEPPRPPRSYRGLAQILAALIIVMGLAATISWQWSNISAFYQFFTHIGAKPPAQSTREAPAPEPKFSERVPQEQSGTQAPSTGAPTTQPVPAVAQRVVLYEEDPKDPQGRRFVGSAIWRTETVSPGAGLAPELAVRADVEIPERRMTVTFSLRRNTDKALPASHTIEIMFNLPADFPGGGIANVPGILMKQAEQARGTPLAGLAVKVTNGFFLVGLSAVDTDMQRNVQLLKERPWFDIPIVYTNGGRAILALEKGTPGDRAFADAFAAWEKK